MRRPLPHIETSPEHVPLAALKKRGQASRSSQPRRRAFSLVHSLGLGLGLAAALLPGHAALADQTWDNGAGNQDWNNPVNWTNDTFPNGDNAIINTAAAGAFPIISATPTTGTPSDIRIGAGGTGRLDQTAGQAGTGNGNWMFLGYGGGNATYNLANTAAGGGTLTGYGQGSGSFTTTRFIMGLDDGTTATANMNTSGTLLVTDTLFVGSVGNTTATFNLDNGTVNTPTLEVAGRQYGQTSGTALFRMSGGVVNVSGVTYIAPANNNGGVQKGTLTVSGGTFNSENDLVMGFAGGAAAQAALNINGGTVNVASTTTRYMVVGQYDTVNSAVTVNSGNLNLNANTEIHFSLYGNSGTNTMTLNGGAITSYSGNQTGAGAGVLDLNGYNGQGGGNGVNTFNLNGGTLTIAQVRASNAAGTSTFNFNGGTLTATQASAAFITGLTAANVQGGGAKINTNGVNVTIPQALLHGGAGTDGGLTKSGAGQLELTAVNTFNGATNIQAGTLLLSTGTIASTSASVTGGGALTLGNNNANNNALPDNLTLSLVSGTTLNLNASGGTETIMTLLINGSAVTPGTYLASTLNGMGGVMFTSGFGETLTVTAVPEPSTWASGLLGLGLLGYSQRRRVQSWVRKARVA